MTAAHPPAMVERALWITLVGAALAACSHPTPGGEQAPDASTIAQPDSFTIDPKDDDADQIPDQLEDMIMQKLGPELLLPPDEVDWTRPANVDWFLPLVHMRFDHPNCPDDGSNLLNVGAITFANIATQTHHTKSSPVTLCHHNTDAASERFSNKSALEFFLQAEDDNLVHPGIPPARMSEWRVYFQVRPSTFTRPDGVVAKYDLQVWYFFAYNDGFSAANHEADWEHLTLSISDDLEVVSVYLAAHDGGHRFNTLSDLRWDGTHVVAYLADGSHATYESAGAHAGPVVDDHCYDGGPNWKTWTNAMNLGDVGHVLNGQTWATYGGRWGEVGMAGFTSGPPGPVFQGKWDTKNEYQ